MHNMHNLLLGFENFPFCTARRSRLFCDALTYALTEEEAREIMDSSDAAFRLYLKGLMFGRHLHHIPPCDRRWICWLMRASTGGLYFLLAVSCIMCMTSLQRSQVLHPFSSNDLWLLVLLHVGDRGRPCSGGYKSEIEPQDSIGSG